jgi:hypothetical protein
MRRTLAPELAVPEPVEGPRVRDLDKLCASKQKLALAKTMNVILVENSHFSLLSDEIISQIGEQQNRIVPNNEVKLRYKMQPQHHRVAEHESQQDLSSRVLEKRSITSNP